MANFTRGRNRGNGSPPQEKKTPVASYEFPVHGGKLELAVWESTFGEGENEKVSNNVTFKRSYFDSSSKQWKDTQFLRQGDLPVLAIALQTVYSEIVLNNDQP